MGLSFLGSGKETFAWRRGGGGRGRIAKHLYRVNLRKFETN